MIDLALKGRNTLAQGDGLALKGRNTLAQGEAL
jgi:hypothetical protein